MKKKLVISTEIYAALCDYQHKVGLYTDLTNDNYENEFHYALLDIEDSAKVLDRLIRGAEKV